MYTMTYRILVTAPTLALAGKRALAAAECSVTYIQDANSAAEIEHILQTQAIDAVISRTAPLTAAAIAACPSLRVICKHGVGVTNIDVAAATLRHVPVFTTPGTNTISVAELTIALILAAARRVTFFDRELRAGRWTRTGDGQQLSGRTLGLVGFGQIGQQVARVATALGMHVAAYDPAMTDSSAFANVTRVASFDTLCASADVLSLHCPVTPKTRGMIDAKAIAALPHGAILINTARGELVDEAALVTALTSGKLAAAGLDTYAEEPLGSHHALLGLPNVVLTPHVGGSTPEALDAVSVAAVRICLDYLRGTAVDPACCVNPETLNLHKELQS
jgi:D-3-phosphoglycerate dehydrogenase